MNDDRRKRLTEFLGECWHSPYLTADGRCDLCKKKVMFSELLHRRSFSSAQDMVDLCKKLVEVGKWDGFEYHALMVKNTPQVSMISLPEYLITNPARTCDLVRGFLEAEDGQK